ncbi:MAG: hypothetical protein ACXWP5_10090 [Bdellovibrionota bacterium]
MNHRAWAIGIIGCAALFAAAGIGFAKRSPEQGSAAAPQAGASPITALTPVIAKAPGSSRQPEAEFSRWSVQVLKTLPTRESLRQLTDEEAHRTPLSVQDAAEELGRIAQAIHDTPAFAEEGREFYRKCAAAEELLTAVRALCFADFTRLDQRLGESEAPAVPQTVRALAAQLPSGV